VTKVVVSKEFRDCEALVTAGRQDRLRNPQLTVLFPQFVTKLQHEERWPKAETPGHGAKI
jgi:hypothetical protein